MSQASKNSSQAQLVSGKKTRSEHRKIYQDPVVARRFETRSNLANITSNETLSAGVMVFAALLAVVVANTPAYEPLHEFFEMPLTIGFGNFLFSISVEAFVNDFLMAMFFLLVGIELKHEIVIGELRRPRQAMLPMLAAVGGVVVPALIYLVINAGYNTASGWAIPIATDIAFALGVMSLLGDKVASETKVFFQTLAIADDILAIVVLALFYGQSPNIAWVAASGIMILILFALNRAKVFAVAPYGVVGFFLWICMFNSGIHATLAGVIIAFFLPVRSDVRLSEVPGWLSSWASRFDDEYDESLHILGQNKFTEHSQRVTNVLHHVMPPLQRVEGYVSLPVNFLILPLFAFVNAQVRLVDVDFASIIANPVTQGAFLGAVVGKPVGIILTTWLLVKLKVAKLPNNVDWMQIATVGIMGGIGFTMSILIAGLAFSDPTQVLAAKTAILVGSISAAALGLIFLSVARRSGRN